MRPEFITNKLGRDFVLYAGLLNEAHEHGLRSIETDLLQFPTPETHMVAIVKAKVTMEQDGVTRTFEGLGDANPDNVNANISRHLIRMAETRAKARALRDGVNVGMVCVDEIDDEEERPRRRRGASEPPRQPNAWERATTAPAPAATPATPGPSATKTTPAPAPMSDAQRRMLWAVGRNQVGWNEQQLERFALKHFGVQIGELSAPQASQMIDRLKNNPEPVETEDLPQPPPSNGQAKDWVGDPNRKEWWDSLLGAGYTKGEIIVLAGHPLAEMAPEAVKALHKSLLTAPKEWRRIAACNVSRDGAIATKGSKDCKTVAELAALVESTVERMRAEVKAEERGGR